MRGALIGFAVAALGAAAAWAVLLRIERNLLRRLRAWDAREAEELELYGIGADRRPPGTYTHSETHNGSH